MTALVLLMLFICIVMPLGLSIGQFGPDEGCPDRIQDHGVHVLSFAFHRARHHAGDR